MYKLNDKISGLTPYTPLAGNFKVRLDANESFLPADNDMVKKLNAAVSAIEYNRYPDPYASRACTAFASYYGVNADCVTAGNGSDELISVIMNGFFCRGDSILITSPDFSMYAFYAHICEVQTIICHKGNAQLDVSADEIVKLARQHGVKGVIFSNPCNPTASAIERENIENICNQLPDTLIVADEAYADFWDGQTLLQKAADYDNLIVLKTCSKMGFAAVRLGFAVANLRITQALRAIKSPYNVNSFTDAAGEIIFSDSRYLKHSINAIKTQRDKLYLLLKGLFGGDAFLSQANFVMVKTARAADIYEHLLKQGIAVRCFSSAKLLRITAGSDSDHLALKKALDKMDLTP